MEQEVGLGSIIKMYTKSLVAYHLSRTQQFALTINHMATPPIYTPPSSPQSSAFLISSLPFCKLLSSKPFCCQYFTSQLVLSNPIQSKCLIMYCVSEGDELFARPSILVNGPLIVGAGPSGLAVGACLKETGVPFVILERSDCIASLWQRKTYDRLKLHLPKKFCQLPKLPFPEDFPEYPTKNQFINYLESYAAHFDLNPQFNETVKSAKYDEVCSMWRVRTTNRTTEVEYICQWLVVATGENAESFVPELEGLSEFGGPVMHACDYRHGKGYKGKKVLVVGCGNSGVELCYDLCHFDAFPSLVVRDSVHILPREVFGKSTFETAVMLMKWLPIRMVDKILLFLARMTLGNIENYGLKRPPVGPMELKNTKGKTPVLDTGALKKIKSGAIEVVPGIKKFMPGRVALVDGRVLDVDAVILATGYRSNVPSWLQGCDFFSKDGFPKEPFPCGWKGMSGLYAVGFTKRGLSGASFDAVRIAEDIGRVWKEHNTACHRRCFSHL